MALLAFEALCVDVADLKHLGGEDINTRIERGAKYIRERYVDLPENDPRRALPPATMMSVILDAMQTSSEALLKDRSFLEYVSDATGFSAEKVTVTSARTTGPAAIPVSASRPEGTSAETTGRPHARIVPMTEPYGSRAAP